MNIEYAAAYPAYRVDVELHVLLEVAGELVGVVGRPVGLHGGDGGEAAAARRVGRGARPEVRAELEAGAVQRGVGEQVQALGHGRAGRRRCVSGAQAVPQRLHLAAIVTNTGLRLGSAQQQRQQQAVWPPDFDQIFDRSFVARESQFGNFSNVLLCPAPKFIYVIKRTFSRIIA